MVSCVGAVGLCGGVVGVVRSCLLCVDAGGCWCGWGWWVVCVGGLFWWAGGGLCGGVVGCGAGLGGESGVGGVGGGVLGCGVWLVLC